MFQYAIYTYSRSRTHYIVIALYGSVLELSSKQTFSVYA